MTATTEAGPRIASLDIVRGVAVMGILAMNIVAFGMPFQAYMNPLAYGMESPADYWSWVFSFIFDRRQDARPLLLPVRRQHPAGHRAGDGERAIAGVASITARMVWLLVFGLIHFYFIWFGDILAGYALVGMLLYFFRDLSVRALIDLGDRRWSSCRSLLFCRRRRRRRLPSPAWRPLPGADPDNVRQWQSMQEQFGILTGQPLADKLALFRGPYSGLVGLRLVEHWAPAVHRHLVLRLGDPGLHAARHGGAQVRLLQGRVERRNAIARWR